MAVARDKRQPMVRRTALRDGLVDIDGARIAEATEQLRHRSRATLHDRLHG